MRPQVQVLVRPPAKRLPHGGLFSCPCVTRASERTANVSRFAALCAGARRTPARVALGPADGCAPVAAGAGGVQGFAVASAVLTVLSPLTAGMPHLLGRSARS